MIIKICSDILWTLNEIKDLIKGEYLEIDDRKEIEKAIMKIEAVFKHELSKSLLTNHLYSMGLGEIENAT